jgi:hypothetical protein
MMHTIQAGTSMAAPHVTGAIALIMQTEPNAPPAMIKSLLFQSAVIDAFTGTVWNKDWGRGKLFIDQATAALLSLFEALAIPAGVELRWRFHEPGSGLRAGVERGAGPSGPWTPIEGERWDDSGIIHFTDATAEAGATYWYRLVVQEGSETFTFGPRSVTAGTPVAGLQLLPVTPNPASGEARIDFAVPRSMEVRLGVYDVQGREVAVLASGVRPAGRHQVTWSGGEAPGLFFIRLVTADRTIVRRLAIVH